MFDAWWMNPFWYFCQFLSCFHLKPCTHLRVNIYSCFVLKSRANECKTQPWLWEPRSFILLGINLDTRSWESAGAKGLLKNVEERSCRCLQLTESCPSRHEACKFSQSKTCMLSGGTLSCTTYGMLNYAALCTHPPTPWCYPSSSWVALYWSVDLTLTCN